MDDFHLQLSLQKRHEDLSSTAEMVEKKAKVLIKLRNYTISKRTEQKNIIDLRVSIPKEKENAIIWCIVSEGAVGVTYIKQLKKAMEGEGIRRGIVITNGKYTQAAKVNAKKSGIELIPKHFPSFNIFDHKFVPKHEILPVEEKEKILEKYRIKPYQLPLITTSDPAAIAIGAKPGDIVKIIRDSLTAGKYVAYRYVVEE